MDIEFVKDRILSGALIDRETALEILDSVPTDSLCRAADEVRRHFFGDEVDSCSIVNARSGLCPEDCHWCAQASRHRTGCQVYNILELDEVMTAASHNDREGISRFSLVTSGRAVSDRDLDRFCEIYRKLSSETDLNLCASMGLLTYRQMLKLREAGVTRYHCNLESSPRRFAQLCTTHLQSDKLETIKAAQQAGLEVCSGGIIGMGETMEDRVDLALLIRETGAVSAPLNILTPIKGTPLQDTPLIEEEEIIRTAAIWRLLMPKVSIRFAGGRMRLSHESMLRMLRGGVNGVLMGDMLTTVSNDIASDRELFREAGMKF